MLLLRYIGLHVKCPLFFSDFNITLLSTIFRATIKQNFMKIRPVGAELFPCGRTDGRTDMTKLIFASDQTQPYRSSTSLLLYTTCFGCPDQPSSGRCRIKKKKIYRERDLLWWLDSWNMLQCIIQYYNFFFPVALRPNAGHGLLIHDVSRSHTTAHHSR